MNFIWGLGSQAVVKPKEISGDVTAPSSLPAKVYLRHFFSILALPAKS
jgi:hypothetical protein